MKTFLFVVVPLHILQVIQDIVFTILLSPSGLDRSEDNIKALRAASLAQVILRNFFLITIVGIGELKRKERERTYLD